VSADNFHNYPVLRHDAAPEIETALIENSSDPPMGAGEPAIAPTPAALLSAVYAATGLRVRQLPLSLGLPRARAQAG
jgi:isoquinoline 1-oxidoreductase beta subunit